MANQNDDLSDVRPDSGLTGNVSPTQLPIRGEKRIIPSPISPTDLSTEFEQAYISTGNPPPSVGGANMRKSSYYQTGRTSIVQQSDFDTTAAMSPYIDYVIIRIYNRGLGGNGTPDGNPAVYRFLINPSQVVVNRTTLDAQAFARSGWQIGVWGEDSLTINLTGKTAGQYFSFGLTDKYQPYTESYRNMEQLQVVFENNGYWFEGEQQAEGPLAANGVGFSQGANFARRLIKMHADVELIVGNFMWYGMFETLTLSQDASSPFLMNFQLSFIAWKERFRKGSPWPDTLHNNVKRGHDYGAWKNAALDQQQNTSATGGTQGIATTPNTTPAVTPAPSTMVPPPQPMPVAPSVSVAQMSYLYPQVAPTDNDYAFTDPLFGSGSPTNAGGWNGVLSPLNFGETT